MIISRTLPAIAVFLLSAVFAVQLSAVEAVLAASNAVNVYEQFTGLSARRAPSVPEISRVRPLHSFNIYILLSKVQTKAGKAHVTGSMSMRDPDGKIVKVFKNQDLIFDDNFTPGTTHLSNLVVTWDFPANAQSGVYSFLLDAVDENNKQKCSKVLKIELVTTPLEPLKIRTNEIRGFISSYYKAPQPERLPELFNIFLSQDEAARKQKNYSPLPFLYGLARALEHHPGLWKQFSEQATDYKTDHKKYLALLFAAIGNNAIDRIIGDVDRETAGYLKKMRENNPWQFNEPYLEEAVNAFWMEFFFTGKPEPLLKIANQLRNRPILTSAEARKKKGGLSPAEARKLRNYFSASCAAWSLRSHVPQHNLAFYYLENMLEQGSFADAAAAAKVQKILAQTAADAAGNTVLIK